jgi:hypothetical protein
VEVGEREGKSGIRSERRKEWKMEGEGGTKGEGDREWRVHR